MNTGSTGPFTLSVSINATMTLVILLRLRTMEFLPFWSDSIVLNENTIVSVIAALLLTLSVPQFLPAATKLGQGNMFTSVCQEFCPQGGRVSAGIHPPSRHPPPEQTPPQEQTPRADTPPGSRPPPPRETDSSIRSTSGRYASYWNAFLFV